MAWPEFGNGDEISPRNDSRRNPTAAAGGIVLNGPEMVGRDVRTSAPNVRKHLNERRTIENYSDAQPAGHQTGGIEKILKFPLARGTVLWYHMSRFQHHVRAWRSGSAVDC